jgi:SAM-dependent methyltransferase
LSIKDKIKWDKKYKDNPKLQEIKEPSFFVKKFALASKGKDALDLACAVGRNALYLESKGFFVDAIDISSVALDILRSKTKGSINIVNSDLDNFVPKKSYDLILMCNYLDRDLIDRVKSSLKRDGIFIIEAYIEDKDNQKNSLNPNYLLKKDELPKFFKDGFEILEYKSFWSESYKVYRMKKASIAIKKI